MCIFLCLSTEKENLPFSTLCQLSSSKHIFELELLNATNYWCRTFFHHSNTTLTISKYTTFLIPCYAQHCRLLIICEMNGIFTLFQLGIILFPFRISSTQEELPCCFPSVCYTYCVDTCLQVKYSNSGASFTTQASKPQSFCSLTAGRASVENS